MSRKCSAVKKNGKICFANVTKPWPVQTCHIHDPNGKFRQQQKRKGYKAHTYKLECSHTWYMREPGIMCTKCGLIWEKETDSESLDS